MDPIDNALGIGLGLLALLALGSIGAVLLLAPLIVTYDPDPEGESQARPRPLMSAVLSGALFLALAVPALAANRPLSFNGWLLLAAWLAACISLGVGSHWFRVSNARKRLQG